MSKTTGGYAGDRSAEDAWNALAERADAVLVDVRTQAEWNFVGIPDLRPLGKEALLKEWQSYPGGDVDPGFGRTLATALAERGAGPDTPVYFICRSGARSQRAALALAAEGYTQAYNVDGGFEGPLDDDGHRGAVGGWKAVGLPWTQS